MGTANFLIDWTFTDSGKTRRQTESLRAQARSAIKQKADTAADVALQVRTRWLDLKTARQRVPIARFAVTQADENVKVITDRYRQQLSTYTEVLDAETRRVTSLNNFYNAIYDENPGRFPAPPSRGRYLIPPTRPVGLPKPGVSGYDRRPRGRIPINLA